MSDFADFSTIASGFYQWITEIKSISIFAKSNKPVCIGYMITLCDHERDADCHDVTTISNFYDSFCTHNSLFYSILLLRHVGFEALQQTIASINSFAITENLTRRPVDNINLLSTYVNHLLIRRRSRWLVAVLALFSLLRHDLFNAKSASVVLVTLRFVLSRDRWSKSTVKQRTMLNWIFITWSRVPIVVFGKTTISVVKL